MNVNNDSNVVLYIYFPFGILSMYDVNTVAWSVNGSELYVVHVLECKVYHLYIQLLFVAVEVTS